MNSTVPVDDGVEYYEEDDWGPNLLSFYWLKCTKTFKNTFMCLWIKTFKKPLRNGGIKTLKKKHL